MSQLASFVRLDLMVIRPYLRNVALTALVMTAAFTFNLGEPQAVFPAVMVLGLLFPNYFFSLDERAHLDTLYATLPGSRWVVVIGRYLSSLVLYLAVGAFGGLLVLVLALLRDESISGSAVALAVTGGFALFGIAAGGQIPVFFAIGYTKARFLAYVPLLVISLGAAALARASSWRPPPGLLESPPFLATSLGAVGLMTLAVSATVSYRVYLSRNL